MPKKILVVDDDENIVKMLTKRLQHSGFDVVSANDGEEAVRKVKSDSPDLVVMDIMMPKMDGTEAARIIRDDPQSKDIPIIYLTALMDENDDFSPSSYATNIVMGKPMDSDKLLEKINELLEEGS